MDVRHLLFCLILTLHPHHALFLGLSSGSGTFDWIPGFLHSERCYSDHDKTHKEKAGSRRFNLGLTDLTRPLPDRNFALHLHDRWSG